jgi:putative membrane protein
VRDGSAAEPDAKPHTTPDVREHLANERTLLSWVRTGVSLLSFGLVIERLGAQVGSSGSSALFGLALAVLGCLVLVLGAGQFLRSRRGIERGEFVSSATAYLVVVAGSLVLAGAFMIYLLLSR